MFGKYEIIIQAQERHIVRLESMIEHLFSALMEATNKSVQLPLGTLQRQEPLVNPYGEMEPDPGTMFDPNIMRP